MEAAFSTRGIQWKPLLILKLIQAAQKTKMAILQYILRLLHMASEPFLMQDTISETGRPALHPSMM